MKIVVELEVQVCNNTMEVISGGFVRQSVQYLVANPVSLTKTWKNSTKHCDILQ